MAPLPSAVHAQPDRFLICGLGSLGQYCIFNLKSFSLPGIALQLIGIDLQSPDHWEVPKLLSLLSEPVVLGDCCREEVLRSAGVEQCRAILLVTNNESVNIQAAIAARRLNPNIRLVVRSSRPRLNDLLEQQLGNFIALEPTEFAASAFALEGLGSGIRGTFDIEGHQLQVVEQEVRIGDRRFDRISPIQAHSKQHRLLKGQRFQGPIFQNSAPANSAQATPLPNSPFAQMNAGLNSGGSPSQTFHQLPPTRSLRPGDRVTYIERLETQTVQGGSARKPWRDWPKPWHLRGSNGAIPRLKRWLRAQPARQVIGLGLVVGLLLWTLGAVVFKLSLTHLTWQKALSIGMVLLLGGYGDVFGGLENEPVPFWLHGISLLITFASLVFVLGGLGLLVDGLISSRFRVLRRRPSLPRREHIILIGFGRVGREVARWAQTFRQSLVVITPDEEHVEQGGNLPQLLGNPSELLQDVHLATAKSVVIVTEDQLLNLELALAVRESAQKLQREIGLVVRTYDQRFSDNLSSLLPDVKVLTAYALAAEAFSGAAFGEDILALFRLRDHTVLVTEYELRSGDTLVEKQLATVAYGYGVVPIFHQRDHQRGSSATENEDSFMPSDDVVLKPGDRLILLASSNGLRRIEYGRLTPAPRWKLSIEKPLNPEFVHSGGNVLVRIAGCDLTQARAFMEQLPSHLELSLYPYQAARLERELSKQLKVELSLLP